MMRDGPTETPSGLTESRNGVTDISTGWIRMPLGVTSAPKGLMYRIVGCMPCTTAVSPQRLHAEHPTGLQACHRTVILLAAGL